MNPNANGKGRFAWAEIARYAKVDGDYLYREGTIEVQLIGFVQSPQGGQCARCLVYRDEVVVPMSDVRSITFAEIKE